LRHEWLEITNTRSDEQRIGTDRDAAIKASVRSMRLRAK